MTNGALSATYSYLANSPLVEQIAFAQNGALRMTTTKQFDLLNRLTQVTNAPVAAAGVKAAYAYNPANQRTALTNADGAYWVYTYDFLGQVTSGKKYWSDGTPVAGQQFEYAFDDIGNRTRTRSGGDAKGANLRQANYSANALNQITTRDVPGYVNLLGSANTAATVTLWTGGGRFAPTTRQGDYFRGELATNNLNGPVWLTVTNLAVLNNGTNADIITNVVGNVFLSKTPETFAYDADGNLTNDGHWVFTWDAENRLKQVESRSDAPTASKRKVTWEFDGRGRRVRQTTYDGSSGNYTVTEDVKFVSDLSAGQAGGWRHIAELNATNNALVRSYVWGLDLSGSLDGAGGVGGLLMLNSAANGAHFCAYDGNGNVVALVKATDGTETARYEYGPFGETVRATGAMAKENPFRFSSKRAENTADLVLYEYRFYNPSTGRWPNRDPIGERGGKNLYAFVRNDPLRFWDALGNETAYFKYHEQYRVEVTPGLLPISDLCSTFAYPFKQLLAIVSFSVASGVGVHPEYLKEDAQAVIDGNSVSATHYSEGERTTFSYSYTKTLPPTYPLCPKGKQRGTVTFSGKFRDDSGSPWEDGPTVKMNYEYECNACCLGLKEPFTVKYEYSPKPFLIDTE